MAEVNNFLDDSDEEDDIQESNDIDNESLDNESDEDDDITNNHTIQQNDNQQNEDDDNTTITTAESLLNTQEIEEQEEEDDDDNAEIMFEDATNDTNHAQIPIKAEDLFAKQAEKDKEENKHLPSPIVHHQTSLSFDLGHMSCYDPVQIDIDALFKDRIEEYSNKHLSKDNTPRKLDQAGYEIRKLKEKYLYDMTRNNVQAMVNKLYSLQPMKTGPNDDPGLVVKLPPPRAKLPRAKPVSFISSIIQYPISILITSHIHS